MRDFFILHVDDMLRTRELYKRLLEKAHEDLTSDPKQPITVIQASNWQDAKHEMLKPGTVFDLIIFDLRFPDTPEGVDVTGKDIDQHLRLREVRRLQPAAAIAVSSAYAFEDDLQTCVEVIAEGLSDEFIPKTLRWPFVLKRIRRALSIKRLREAAAQPYRVNVARTIAEDIDGSISMFESRLRALAYGSPLEGKLKLELQRFRHEVDHIRAYLTDDQTVVPEQTPIAALLDPIRGHFEGQIGRSLKCDGSHGATVYTYKSDLDAALKAVVQNAIDAIKETEIKRTTRDLVELSVADEGRKGLTITVSDQGSGFAPEAIRDLFTPGKSFWTKEKERHLGMGLYVARRRLYSIGGDIAIQEACEGRGGTAVVLTIPNWEPSLS